MSLKFTFKNTDRIECQMADRSNL